MTNSQKPSELGRHLYELNSEALQHFTQMQRENLQQYFDLNIQYLEKLQQTRDLRGLLELQRDYNETLMRGMMEAFEANTSLLREALQGSGSAIREAMTPEEEAATAESKAKAKAKPKTKPKTQTTKAKKPEAEPGAETAPAPDQQAT